MILSHKYKFIFIKTKKTAGTSIEMYLSKFCGNDDVLTHIGRESETRDHVPRNYKGWFNPLPEIIYLNNNLDSSKEKFKSMRKTISDMFFQDNSHGKFYNHMPAFRVKSRVSNKIWDSYYKFCIERNPWDKTLSQYHMRNKKGNLSFDEYISGGNLCINYPRYMDPQQKKIIVDRVAKYENLNNELSEIFKRLDIPFDGELGIRAKGHFRKDRRPYQEIFSNELKKYRNKIDKVFQKEIRMHGYIFDGS